MNIIIMIPGPGGAPVLGGRYTCHTWKIESDASLTLHNTSAGVDQVVAQFAPGSWRSIADESCLTKTPMPGAQVTPPRSVAQAPAPAPTPPAAK